MLHKKILITGCAGFIGFHLAKKLLAQGFEVIGIDNLNDYYDVNLKLDRLAALGLDKQQFQQNLVLSSGQFIFYTLDLTDRTDLQKVFELEKPDYVVNLAAQAGVRYSLKNPYAYIDSNIVGFVNVLENCRHHNVKHLIYASSSSVYGLNEKMPLAVNHNVDHPVSLYAASKKANELMAHSYSHLYGLPTTGLRFFTVYGPWGRPDMALFIFTKKILANEPIDVYNNGLMKRDFTYIDDIVDGVSRLIEKIPARDPNWSGQEPNPGSSKAPYRIFNIGNNQPVELLRFIEIIEKKLGKKAEKNLLPLQAGDVLETFADIDALTEYCGFKPATDIETGVSNFVDWYLGYYEA